MSYAPGAKFMIGNETIIDLTSDTVTGDTLLEGVTAHDKQGRLITGYMTQLVNLNSGSVSKISGTDDDYLLTLT